MLYHLNKDNSEHSISLQEQVEEYLQTYFLDIDQSEPWRLRNTQDEYCSPDNEMGSCQSSQSGTMSAPSTASRGEDKLTLFAEDSLAKTYPAQEKVLASKASAAECGNTWHELSVRYDRDTHSWKTHLCLWDEDLPWSLVTLPKWGMMRSGVCWEQSMPVRHTDETESGLWQTPTCTQIELRSEEAWEKKKVSRNKLGRNSLPPGTLQEQVMMSGSTPCWDWNKSPKNPKTWPTPQARDWKGSSGRSMKGMELDLPTAVKKWPTPIVNDSHNCMMPPSQLTRNNLPGAMLREGEKPNGGHLNPTWVEWLMGWPLEWTGLKQSGMGKFQRWLRSHGKF